MKITKEDIQTILDCQNPKRFSFDESHRPKEFKGGYSTINLPFTNTLIDSIFLHKNLEYNLYENTNSNYKKKMPCGDLLKHQMNTRKLLIFA